MSDKERPFSGVYTDLASFRTNAIDDLCARHGITVEGIVALVDEVCGPLIDSDEGLDYSAPNMDPDEFHFNAGYLRRLARGEEA